MRDVSSPKAAGDKADGAKRVWSTPIVIHESVRGTAIKLGNAESAAPTQGGNYYGASGA